MFYVYILNSLEYDQNYVGFTKDLKARLSAHNSGTVKSTARYKPWQIQTYIAFDSKEKALEFERYLKSGSGHAFRKKRL